MPVNTLFSYFNKTPKASTPENNSKTGNSTSPKEQAKQKLFSEKDASSPGVCKFSEGDVVWAKLEGFPWWPSLVCKHPTEATFFRAKKIHVQFFDETKSRAWINSKFVETFEGLNEKGFQRGGRFFSCQPEIRKGVQTAAEIAGKGVDERLKIIVCCPSDNEEEDEEDMDVDSEEINTSNKENDSEENVEEDVKEDTKNNKRPKRSAVVQSKKRRRIVVESGSEESDGDEFKPGEEEGSDSDNESSGVEEEEEDSSVNSDPETPQKSRKRKRSTKPSVSLAPGNRAVKRSITEVIGTPKTPATLAPKTPTTLTPRATFTPSAVKSFPSVSLATKSKLSSFKAEISSPSGPPTEDGEAKYPHQTYDWLKDGKRKDLKGLVHGDPDYDPSTLYVPKSFLDKWCTPAMRQWWEMKSKYYDSVMFFKMGKFYELYHLDADIGVKELGIIYMKGGIAHCGFPEIAFGRYSETLVQKGYRVLRVEQTETPNDMQERCRKMGGGATKFDKVVKREACRVTTLGTRTFSFIDGVSCDAKNNYLLSIAERPSKDTASGGTNYGVCFIDTSIGKFHIGQFQDDRHCSRIRTLLAHYTPAQVLFERGKQQLQTQQILNNNLLSVLKEPLAPGSQFWSAEKTLKHFVEENYMMGNEEGNSDGGQNVTKWPETLQGLLAEGDSLGLTPREGKELALSAFGACIWYLKKCYLHQELLSMKNFTTYVPVDDKDSIEIKNIPTDFTTRNRHMVLDGVTLANLDILENKLTGTTEGTLLGTMEQCSTPFGKRLFKQWLCAPLCNPDAINDRLNSIEDLLSAPEIVGEVKEILIKLPDLDRLLSKIHSLGLKRKGNNHPDSRAIFFEDVAYSKKKIEDFLVTLEGFKSAMRITKLFEKKEVKSTLLNKSVTLLGPESQGIFPDLAKLLRFFEHAFDHKKAKQQGAIVPSPGVNQDYDTAIADIKGLNRELNAVLERQKKRLGCSKITYWGTGKNRFQLEIPESALSRHTPDEYDLQSQKKGFKRYWTNEIKELLENMMAAEDRRDSALKDSMRAVFHQFDENYEEWQACVQCLSVLDVLLSLTSYSQAPGMCRPKLVLPGNDEKPFISIRDARHACIAHTASGDDFIPNDTYIGIANENDSDSSASGSCVLVTGPNMGGKSTLMRQVGLVVVIAQLGCYVPAEACTLTPVDRIFTRLGASDNIMAGESTFFVELSETSSILQHATTHSLVLLDELGRGTATYDGTAIASAVVKELTENIKCRTLFSTHYHSLVEDFAHDPNIQLGHMACMVENENDDDPSQETITFLYKFVKGACPKSYGFNAARLANIPDEIIKVAKKKAADFEASSERLKLLRALNRISTSCKIEDLISMRNSIKLTH
ncbi:DNA mismatch repair protein Msh6-like [Antedon mediterranea]|uniref:DNA mismatch repair protein Msh6-like n=1 Tax=Antedon mediterranea TaxID=105859 RepID=UPI003AF4F2E3